MNRQNRVLIASVWSLGGLFLASASWADLPAECSRLTPDQLLSRPDCRVLEPAASVTPLVTQPSLPKAGGVAGGGGGGGGVVGGGGGGDDGSSTASGASSSRSSLSSGSSSSGRMTSRSGSSTASGSTASSTATASPRAPSSGGSLSVVVPTEASDATSESSSTTGGGGGGGGVPTVVPDDSSSEHSFGSRAFTTGSDTGSEDPAANARARAHYEATLKRKALRGMADHVAQEDRIRNQTADDLRALQQQRRAFNVLRANAADGRPARREAGRLVDAIRAYSDALAGAIKRDDRAAMVDIRDDLDHLYTQGLALRHQATPRTAAEMLPDLRNAARVLDTADARIAGAMPNRISLEDDQGNIVYQRPAVIPEAFRPRSQRDDDRAPVIEDPFTPRSDAARDEAVREEAEQVGRDIRTYSRALVDAIEHDDRQEMSSLREELGREFDRGRELHRVATPRTRAALESAMDPAVDVMRAASAAVRERDAGDMAQRVHDRNLQRRTFNEMRARTAQAREAQVDDVRDSLRTGVNALEDAIQRSDRDGIRQELDRLGEGVVSAGENLRPNQRDALHQDLDTAEDALIKGQNVLVQLGKSSLSALPVSPATDAAASSSAASSTDVSTSTTPATQRPGGVAFDASKPGDMTLLTWPARPRTPPVVVPPLSTVNTTTGGAAFTAGGPSAATTASSERRQWERPSAISIANIDEAPDPVTPSTSLDPNSVSKRPGGMALTVGEKTQTATPPSRLSGKPATTATTTTTTASRSGAPSPFREDDSQDGDVDDLVRAAAASAAPAPTQTSSGLRTARLLSSPVDDDDDDVGSDERLSPLTSLGATGGTGAGGGGLRTMTAKAPPAQQQPSSSAVSATSSGTGESATLPPVAQPTAPPPAVTQTAQPAAAAMQAKLASLQARAAAVRAQQAQNTPGDGALVEGGQSSTSTSAAISQDSASANDAQANFAAHQERYRQLKDAVPPVAATTAPPPSPAAAPNSAPAAPSAGLPRARAVSPVAPQNEPLTAAAAAPAVAPRQSQSAAPSPANSAVTAPSPSPDRLEDTPDDDVRSTSSMEGGSGLSPASASQLPSNRSTSAPALLEGPPQLVDGVSSPEGVDKPIPVRRLATSSSPSVSPSKTAASSDDEASTSPSSSPAAASTSGQPRRRPLLSTFLPDKKAERAAAEAAEAADGAGVSSPAKPAFSGAFDLSRMPAPVAQPVDRLAEAARNSRPALAEGLAKMREVAAQRAGETTIEFDLDSPRGDAGGSSSAAASSTSPETPSSATRPSWRDAIDARVAQHLAAQSAEDNQPDTPLSADEVRAQVAAAREEVHRKYNITSPSSLPSVSTSGGADTTSPVVSSMAAASSSVAVEAYEYSPRSPSQLSATRQNLNGLFGVTSTPTNRPADIESVDFSTAVSLSSRKPAVASQTDDGVASSSSGASSETSPRDTGRWSTLKGGKGQTIAPTDSDVGGRRASSSASSTSQSASDEGFQTAGTSKQQAKWRRQQAEQQAQLRALTASSARRGLGDNRFAALRNSDSDSDPETPSASPAASTSRRPRGDVFGGGLGLDVNALAVASRDTGPMPAVTRLADAVADTSPTASASRVPTSGSVRKTSPLLSSMGAAASSNGAVPSQGGWDGITPPTPRGMEEDREAGNTPRPTSTDFSPAARFAAQIAAQNEFQRDQQEIRDAVSGRSSVSASLDGTDADGRTPPPASQPVVTAQTSPAAAAAARRSLDDSAGGTNASPSTMSPMSQSVNALLDAPLRSPPRMVVSAASSLPSDEFSDAGEKRGPAVPLDMMASMDSSMLRSQDSHDVYAATDVTSNAGRSTDARDFMLSSHDSFGLPPAAGEAGASGTILPTVVTVDVNGVPVPELVTGATDARNSMQSPPPFAQLRDQKGLGSPFGKPLTSRLSAEDGAPPATAVVAMPGSAMSPLLQRVAVVTPPVSPVKSRAAAAAASSSASTSAPATPSRILGPGSPITRVIAAAERDSLVMTTPSRKPFVDSTLTIQSFNKANVRDVAGRFKTANTTQAGNLEDASSSLARSSQPLATLTERRGELATLLQDLRTLRGEEIRRGKSAQLFADTTSNNAKKKADRVSYTTEQAVVATQRSVNELNLAIARRTLNAVGTELRKSQDAQTVVDARERVAEIQALVDGVVSPTMAQAGAQQELQTRIASYQLNAVRAAQDEQHLEEEQLREEDGDADEEDDDTR